MRPKLLLCLLLALAMMTSILTVHARAETSGGLSRAVILIIRHAEPADGDGLSSDGNARARAYANYFRDFTIDGKPLKLNYLFAAADSRNSHRPRLTIEPTAQALGLSVDSRFKNRQFLELVDEIKTLPQGATILICWHHGEIPQLLRALGADANMYLPHGKWPSDIFNWLIELRYDGKGQLFDSKRIEENLP
jgi:hypothetical protein